MEDTTILIISGIVGLVFVGVLVYGIVYAYTEFKTQWMPAVLAGLFLIGIVPYANELYWKRQKRFETCIQDRLKRYELLGSAAKTYTSIFKSHTRLYQLSQARSEEEQVIHKLAKQPNKATNARQIHTGRLASIQALQSDLEKELIHLQGQLGADSALIAHYFPAVVHQYSTLAKKYDRRISSGYPFLPTQADSLVQKVNELITSMAAEARTHECK
jgi:hypothetical protein